MYNKEFRKTLFIYIHIYLYLQSTMSIVVV